MPRQTPFRLVSFLLLAIVLLAGAARAEGPSPSGTAAPLSLQGGAASLPVAADPGATSPWFVEAVDAPPYFTTMGPRSIALSADGLPRIAYGGDHLYYAVQRTDGTWYLQTVDASSGVGNYTSLALDSSGRGHISYQGGANDDLKYTHFICDYFCGWAHETVDTGNTAFHTAIALDGADYPHIAYFSMDGTLHYAYKDGSGWHLETVDSGLGTWGGDVSLALDGAGHPHISYYDGTNYDLKYATNNGAAWGIAVVDGATSSVGQYSSIALNYASLPRISYHDATNGDLKYAWFDGTTWHVEVVDSAGNVGTFTSLAIGSTGYPQISYRKNDGTYLRFAWNDGTWHSELVDAGSNTGYYTSLALNSTNHPRVSYYDATDHRIRYAYKDAAGWTMETVDSGSAFLGWDTSIATSPGGYRMISYGDSAHDLLKFAYRESGTWTLMELDGNGNRGTSLALNSLGRPHISHVDETQSQLLYTFYVGPGGNCGPSSWWRCMVADSGPNQVGWYSSLDLDSANIPNFSHYDRTDGDLEYTYWDGAIWHPTTVDSAGDVGQYTSLKVDAVGDPHIAYYDVSNGHLKFAYRQGGVWSVETVDSAAGTGDFASLALDAAGRPHISYAADGHTALKYAWYDGAAWQFQTVDTGSYVAYTSLALDASGRAYISYYSSPTVGNLRVANFVGAGGNCGPGNSWRCVLVDDDIYAGPYGSIALDEFGHPCVSYQDNADGDLRYAEWGQMILLPLVDKK